MGAIFQITAAVNKLLQLKAEYKAKTGKDYAPPPAPTKDAPKSSQPSKKVYHF